MVPSDAPLSAGSSDAAVDLADSFAGLAVSRSRPDPAQAAIDLCSSSEDEAEQQPGVPAAPRAVQVSRRLPSSRPWEHHADTAEPAGLTLGDAEQFRLPASISSRL